MWPFKKREERFIKRSEFEELRDEVASLTMRLRKLRARHLASENEADAADRRNINDEATKILTEQKNVETGVHADRASLNRIMLQRKGRL